MKFLAASISYSSITHEPLRKWLPDKVVTHNWSVKSPRTWGCVEVPFDPYNHRQITVASWKVIQDIVAVFPVFSWFRIHCQWNSVEDPKEAPGPPLLILDQTKKFLETAPPPPLISGSGSGWPPPLIFILILGLNPPLELHSVFQLLTGFRIPGLWSWITDSGFHKPKSLPHSEIRITLPEAIIIRFLGNCPRTTPLSQHLSRKWEISVDVGLREG